MVLDKYDYLIYMSRAMVPYLYGWKPENWWKDLFKNVGVSLFSREFLNRLNAQCHNTTGLNVLEGLEQCRWLELGFKIKCIEIKHFGFGVDEPWQLEALESRCIEVEKQE